jgi:cobalt-zinc-cadmium resistance protein CzcA
MITLPVVWSVTHRRWALAICGFIALGGIWSCWQEPLDAYPDISLPQVLVITEFPGRAPEDIERQITIPIELAMDDVPKVVAVRSRTILGLSIVELVFELDTEKYFARQRVQECLGTVTFPEGVIPRLGPLSTAYGEIYRYELTSDGTVSPLELRTLQDWVVAIRLRRIAGVAEVVTFGGHEQEFSLTLDPRQLARYSLTLDDVVDAIRTNNADSGGSLVRRGEMSVVIRGRGLLKNIGDLENTVLDSAGGSPVYVHDVAEVDIDTASRQGIFGKDERPDGVEGIVLLTRDENPSRILARIKAEVQDLNQILPEGVRIESFYDRDSLVRSTFETVGFSVAAGITLIGLALLAFFGSPTLALLVVTTIPFALLFALLVLYLADVPLGLLSIGAIDFGILVDGAVLMLDYFSRRLPRSAEAAQKDGQRRTVLALAAEVRRPILLASLIVACAYLPLLMLTDVEGLIFRPLALTAILALAGAVIFSLSVIPSIAHDILKQGTRVWDNPLLAALHVRYLQLLGWILRARWLVVPVAVLSSGALGGWILPRLGLDFLPALDEGAILVRASFPAGTALEQTAAFGDEMRSMVRSFAEVAFVTSQAGRNEQGTDPFVTSRLEMMIGLKARDEWSFSSQSELLDSLAARLRDRFPTTRFSFTQPIIDSVTQDVSGTSADFAVEVSGPEFATLHALGQRIASVLRTVPGAVDVNVEEEEEQPQLIIDPDRARCARYGVQIEAVNRLINTAIGGEPVGTLYDGERRFKIAVRFPPHSLGSVESIGQLPVFTASGAPLPLASLANFQFADGQTLIKRDRGRRCVTVRCDIAGRDQFGFKAAASRRVAAEVKLPDGYRLEWIGFFENLPRLARRLLLAGAVTLAIVLGLLVAILGNRRKALLVLLPGPFALVGGAVALYARGMTLNISSCVGFSTLFGVSMLNGILLVRAIDARWCVGPTLDDAILDGARRAFRPILMTTSLGMLGLLPASLAFGVGAGIQRPLATVVVWGLFSSALLTLFVLPALARMFWRPVPNRRGS